MAPLEADNTAAAELSTATDASAAISRMRAAPVFLSDEDWRALESTRGSALVGNAKGAPPEGLEEDDESS